MVTSREIERREALRDGSQEPTRRRSRRRLPAAQRRALIEQAAARLFAQRGFRETTVAQICAAAGVSKPMLYRHFESKQELQMRLLERRRDELAAAPIGRFMETEGSLQERLAAMIDAWFEHVEEHRDSSRLLFQDVTGDELVRDLQQELRRRQRAADVALLREFGPPLPEQQLEPLGEIIRSSLTGLALWWLARPEVERAVVVAAMLRMLDGMLAPA
ncbi:MAG TPA: TetR/AcrR family transcriptional regulator [Solirubrobacteraceae bacterium]|jgi:AcrR family transcriptional regulator|nr:TetR/AcrR family transcriptional regulator [Solirubrobacteraceae bacterium]